MGVTLRHLLSSSDDVLFLSSRCGFRNFVCPVEGRAKYCSAQALGLSDLSRLQRSRSVKTRGHHCKKMGGPGPDRDTHRTGTAPGSLVPVTYASGTMTTLDDKLLGEKCQYYYSSSEDEDSEQERKIRQSAGGECDGGKEGSAINTGPKGVINDWRRYKQLETEQSEEQKRELEQLVKRLSMTCKSHLDEEKEKQKQKELDEKLHGKMTMQEYNQLNKEDDEDFLEQYRKQRIEEMKQQLCHSQVYQKVFDIRSGEEFLDTVDKEHKSTVVVILIYEDEGGGRGSCQW
ncbi:unnamed protein product [Ranitomeya imitator]|uniref:Phosducin domain-containing protein n=1 Tax=Ranitomeya imitator TaxID=111125 RepID=A0ABN9LGJ7_9NEOB|nr:unnamed protein product [Ranitomeya imitator]